ncbi:hypothetical protein ABCW43_00290 [Neorhizobium sp. IRAMC:178]|uniref:hypothetical protein n=1 Tax=Neorhizobium tunisiense TaxID=3144793 RepID=UPI0031F6618D
MKTVKLSQLSSLKMVSGGETRHPKVILDGNLKEWVGFGWIDEGPASPADEKKYPTVITD